MYVCMYVFFLEVPFRLQKSLCAFWQISNAAVAELVHEVLEKVHAISASSSSSLAAWPASVASSEGSVELFFAGAVSALVGSPSGSFWSCASKAVGKRSLLGVGLLSVGASFSLGGLACLEVVAERRGAFESCASALFPEGCGGYDSLLAIKVPLYAAQGACYFVSFLPEGMGVMPLALLRVGLIYTFAIHKVRECRFVGALVDVDSTFLAF